MCRLPVESRAWPQFVGEVELAWTRRHRRCHHRHNLCRKKPEQPIAPSPQRYSRHSLIDTEHAGIQPTARKRTAQRGARETGSICDAPRVLTETVNDTGLPFVTGRVAGTEHVAPNGTPEHPKDN